MQAARTARGVAQTPRRWPAGIPCWRRRPRAEDRRRFAAEIWKPSSTSAAVAGRGCNDGVFMPSHAVRRADDVVSVRRRCAWWSEPPPLFCRRYAADIRRRAVAYATPKLPPHSMPAADRALLIFGRRGRGGTREQPPALFPGTTALRSTHDFVTMPASKANEDLREGLASPGRRCRHLGAIQACRHRPGSFETRRALMVARRSAARFCGATASSIDLTGMPAGAVRTLSATRRPPARWWRAPDQRLRLGARQNCPWCPPCRARRLVEVRRRPRHPAAEELVRLRSAVVRCGRAVLVADQRAVMNRWHSRCPGTRRLLRASRRSQPCRTDRPPSCSGRRTEGPELPGGCRRESASSAGWRRAGPGHQQGDFDAPRSPQGIVELGRHADIAMLWSFCRGGRVGQGDTGAPVVGGTMLATPRR